MYHKHFICRHFQKLHCKALQLTRLSRHCNTHRRLVEHICCVKCIVHNDVWCNASCCVVIGGHCRSTQIELDVRELFPHFLTRFLVICILMHLVGNECSLQQLDVAQRTSIFRHKFLVESRLERMRYEEVVEAFFELNIISEKQKIAALLMKT